MKQYTVTISVPMTVTFQVKAESETEVWRIVRKAHTWHGLWEAGYTPELTDYEPHHDEVIKLIDIEE